MRLHVNRSILGSLSKHTYSKTYTKRKSRLATAALWSHLVHRCFVCNLSNNKLHISWKFLNSYFDKRINTVYPKELCELWEFSCRNRRNKRKSNRSAFRLSFRNSSMHFNYTNSDVIASTWCGCTKTDKRCLYVC